MNYIINSDQIHSLDVTMTNAVTLLTAYRNLLLEQRISEANSRSLKITAEQIAQLKSKIDSIYHLTDLK